MGLNSPMVQIDLQNVVGESAGKQFDVVKPGSRFHYAPINGSGTEKIMDTNPQNVVCTDPHIAGSNKINLMK
jgi:hypothetical protein